MCLYFQDLVLLIFLIESAEKADLYETCTIVEKMNEFKVVDKRIQRAVGISKYLAR